MKQEKITRSSTSRDRQETGQLSYRHERRWLIRILGGDDAKKGAGNLARDALLSQCVLSTVDDLLGDLLP